MSFHVRDPIYTSVRIEDWMERIVDSPVMQRLRRVGQLGTASLVYPGANHRRFEHSLGASHVAGRLARSMDLDENQRRLARAASLLHDVGHGPFSHAFEELMRRSGHRHEETTVDLVQWGPLADLLRQGDINPTEVAEAVHGKGPIGSIVAGSLDADRMDYLVRDAHYTGVKCGADPARIAGTLEQVDGEIVLRESGLVAAEAFLTTRFLMYPAVYLHHTVRSSERMLQTAILALDEPLDQLQRETDDGILWRLRQAGGVSAELVGRLDNRRLYKRAWETKDDGGVAAKLMAMDPDSLQQEIAGDAGVPEHHVLVDIPRAPRYRETGLRVLRRDGDLVPLAEASGLVQSLEASRMDHWRAWVFAAPGDEDAVGAATAKVLDTLK